MLVLNLVWVFDPAGETVLMCKRHKEPYQGLYNLLGGKVDTGEDRYAAANRELEEESSIKTVDLKQGLHHLLDFTYYGVEYKGVKEDWLIEVYVGKLSIPLDVAGDEKELVWMSVKENFFDMTKFAGEGNIGHIYEQIKLNPCLME